MCVNIKAFHRPNSLEAASIVINPLKGAKIFTGNSPLAWKALLNEPSYLLPLTPASILSILLWIYHFKSHGPSVSFHPFLSSAPLYLLFLLAEGSMSGFLLSVRSQFTQEYCKEIVLDHAIEIRPIQLFTSKNSPQAATIPWISFYLLFVYCVSPSLKYNLDQYQHSYLTVLFTILFPSYCTMFEGETCAINTFGMPRWMFPCESNRMKCLRLFW